MKAAVISSFDQPPHYDDYADPTPKGPGEMLVEVLAAGLHHVTRGRASGVHYSSSEGLPLVPGIDGVGRGTDGKLRYFAQGPGQMGTMATKTVIEVDHSFVLPDDCNPVAVAAAMNPGMSAWLALRCRMPLKPGQKVLILGATGSSGNMAVQIARHLGASQIIAAGRDPQKLAKLPELGATQTMSLSDPQLGALAREVDVVLDYVWGEGSVQLMGSLLKQRPDRSQPLTWVQIGSMGGDVAAIPGALLRSANLQIVGSGNGSVAMRDIFRELPALVKEIAAGIFHIEAKAVPLSEVEQVWAASAHSSERIVIIPGGAR
ncbi:TPA: quinone oxidoreductase family protein [Yersinia enterocolitica]|jgi:NADPH:quinone reductase-like Zn-dependent oxidoreductase